MTKKKGFTLIEIIIVVVIIGILTSMSFSFYINQQKKEIFKNSYTEVLTFLKQSRILSSVSQTINITPAKKERPKGGYGVFIDQKSTPKKLILFADTWNKSAGLDGKEVSNDLQNPVPADHMYTNAKDFLLEKLELKIIDIEKIKGQSENEEENYIGNNLFITFSIPSLDAEIIDETGKTYQSLNIFLKGNNPAEEKNIYIHKISGFFTFQ